MTAMVEEEAAVVDTLEVAVHRNNEMEPTVRMAANLNQ